MGQGQRLPAVRLAGLERHHGDPTLVGEAHRLDERRRVAEALDIEPDGGHAVLGGHGFDHVAEADLRAIADSQDVGQRQRALLHAQVDGDVGGLADQRDPALDPLPAVNIRPQRRTAEVVDQAVAVGAENRHITRGSEQLILQGASVVGLGPARREAGGPARPARR